LGEERSLRSLQSTNGSGLTFRAEFIYKRRRAVGIIETRNEAALWREKAARFTLKYRDFIPVRGVKDVLFLELKPVIAMVRNHQNTEVLMQAEIHVHRRSKPAHSER
jgi:hypothetical protein